MDKKVGRAKNIVLIGFMGTGKTSVGRLLAARLGRRFIDIDRKIEQENKMTIAEMFASHGEEFFRRKEREMVARVSRFHGAVIATGGGTVLVPENMERLRASGFIVSLTASVQTILERTGRRNTRPLLERPDREEFVTNLLAEREKLYRQADLCINTDHSAPIRTVEKIVEFVRREGQYHG